MSPLLQSNLRALCHILFILLQQTLQSHSQSCPGAQLIAPSPTCPGQEAVFTCSADDANGRGATVFQVNENGADECVLDHDMMDPSTPTCGPSGVFTAALESVVNNVTYTSTLTVTASVSLDGVRVRCLAGTVNTASPLSVITTPQLPDAVRQNNCQIALNRTINGHQLAASNCELR